MGKDGERKSAYVRATEGLKKQSNSPPAEWELAVEHNPQQCERGNIWTEAVEHSPQHCPTDSLCTEEASSSLSRSVREGWCCAASP